MFRQNRSKNEVFLPILPSIAMIPKNRISRGGLPLSHSMQHAGWGEFAQISRTTLLTQTLMIEYLVHQSELIEELPLLELEPLMAWISEDYQLSGKLSIAVLSDPEIREINNRYLGHDYETDCISFNLADEEDVFEGEVIISADTARRVASQIGWDPKYEACLYIIHGVLHILGYDDDTQEAKSEMRALERHYLQKLEIPGWERHPTQGEADYLSENE